jgi:cytochrome c oxidase cbb3-type subunit 2
MKMTPAMLILGGLLVFWASISIMVAIPAATFHPAPSDIWRPLTREEEEGHRLYVQNGCSYCHSQYVRIMDWGHDAVRIAEAGDYVGIQPPLLGTERTGPDLSQEGGIRSYDWHVAHFTNPRYTSPISLMPSWEFLGEKSINRLIAYMESEGRKLADFRVARQRHWKGLAMEAYESGADRNIAWLHRQIPAGWRPLPNPYPAGAEALLRGQKIYQEFCLGCHGMIGDGQGPAAPYLHPPPLNFTTLRRNLVEGKYIGGVLYYQVMNGVTGTAMPFFKIYLTSEKIWDVSNYVAAYFIGYTDAAITPRGIPAAYEGTWVNTFETPTDLGELGPAQRRPDPREMNDPGR